jgi:hypothetical protein
MNLFKYFIYLSKIIIKPPFGILFPAPRFRKPPFGTVFTVLYIFEEKNKINQFLIYVDVMKESAQMGWPNFFYGSKPRFYFTPLECCILIINERKGRLGILSK